ncbi:MAG: hypothetical protein HRT53_11635 [Colwellia sp.]|nr:hypothetical protein [Colwellia sp.]
MKFKFASSILAVYAIIALGVFIFSGFEHKAVINLFSYAFLYIVIPAYGAFGIWKHKQRSVFISLLFFVSQSIRTIGGDNWFIYGAPFSLGMAFGDFSDGQGYLVDYFAISMAVFLALLFWTLYSANKQLSN